MSIALAPPTAWAPHDQQLWRRACQHVAGAIADGALPHCDDDEGAADTELFAPLRNLLLAHRTCNEPSFDRLADTIARACLGSHHLWQDLGLTGRDEVSRLMELGFPTLFQSNTHNLRWKRHLFLCLGQSLGRTDLKPPKCDHCELYSSCMGSPAPTFTSTVSTILMPHGR